MVPAAEVGDLRDGLRVRTRVNGEVVQDGLHARLRLAGLLGKKRSTCRRRTCEPRTGSGLHHQGSPVGAAGEWRS